MIRTFRPHSAPPEDATGSHATASAAKTSRCPCSITEVDTAKSSVTPTGTPRKRVRRIA